MPKQGRQISAGKKSKTQSSEKKGLLEGKELKDEFTKRGVPASELGGKSVTTVLQRKGQGQGVPFEQFLASISEPVHIAYKDKAKLPDSELRECLEKYNHVDTSSEASAAFQEFKKISFFAYKNLLRQHNPETPDDAFLKSFRVLDSNNDGKIELREWLKAYKKWVASEAQREKEKELDEIRKAFEVLDEDQDGYVTLDDFLRISHYVTKGEKIKPSDAEKEARILFDKVSHKQGQLSLETFTQAFLKMHESKGKKKKKKKKKKS